MDSPETEAFVAKLATYNQTYSRLSEQLQDWPRDRLDKICSLCADDELDSFGWVDLLIQYPELAQSPAVDIDSWPEARQRKLVDAVFSKTGRRKWKPALQERHRKALGSIRSLERLMLIDQL